MLPQNDPHDERNDDARIENLVLLAFGEPVDDWFDAHRAGCPECQRDLLELRETVALGHEITEVRSDRMPVPPEAVWDRIANELDLPSARAEAGSRPTARPERSKAAANPALIPAQRSSPWRKILAVAAAVIVLAGAAGIGVVFGRDSKSGSARVVSQAQLGAQRGGPSGVSGAVTVSRSDDRMSLAISTAGLPLRQGYYQVWLYDPTEGLMVPVGALAGNGSGRFTLPEGVDLRSYDVIDVSAQDYAANRGKVVHEQSVLRGPLTS